LNANTFRTLEFEKIRTLLLSQAGSADGRLILEALGPSTEPGTVRAALALTSEAAQLLQERGRQPYHDLPDLAEARAASRVEGQHLEPGGLLDVASFIEGSAAIAKSVGAASGAPTLAQQARGIADVTEVATAIRIAILPSGEVADSASARLAEIRRQVARQRAALQSVLESLLHGKDADRLLQDKLVTTRNDRYVLLLKAEHRGQLPGIVHGSSGSGASLFVEPLPAVELNNEIVALQEEERNEVRRILRALTALVGSRVDALARAAQILGELDALQAKALLARDMRATAPEIVAALELDLVNARHPMLIPALAERLGAAREGSKEPVPVSLRVGFGNPVLVISGPNTGGKTVALKTVGLLAMMAQSGLHIPADAGSRLPVFQRIYADIGDDQSIAHSLSTFSAHLATIVEMTCDLPAPALVLLDEVGAGTDPTEGGGLGVAIVDHFRAAGAMVVATTHHGLMKAYAQSTPNVSSASFAYDPVTYAPTYRLVFGVPGRSLALEMAERLGLPAAVVTDARSRLSQTELQAEVLLKQLEEQRSALEAEARRLDSERKALEAGTAELLAAERALGERKRVEVEAFARELRRRGEEAARKASEAIRAAVQRVEATRRSALNEGARARGEALQQIQTAQQDLLRDIAPPEAEAQAPLGPLAVGSRVRVRSLGVIGEVMSLAGVEVELAVGGKRLRVPCAEVVVLRGAKPPVDRGQPGAGVAAPWRTGDGAPMAAEINVVGLTVDEALPLVDKFLDDAALTERREIRVVHGFGTGTLRKAVAGLLDGHPHVSTFRPGGPREGGGGATVVALRD
jgi:DNA mismatch repair protein MutS2